MIGRLTVTDVTYRRGITWKVLVGATSDKNDREKFCTEFMLERTVTSIIFPLATNAK